MVFCLTEPQNEAVSKEVMNFSRSLQTQFVTTSISKSPNTICWYESYLEPSKALQIMEGDAVWATQKTLKQIEGSREAKWAHIAHLEAMQDRSQPNLQRLCCRNKLTHNLHSSEEWTKKNWCSVNWFIALQQLIFLRRILLEHLSLFMNFRHNLLLVHL